MPNPVIHFDILAKGDGKKAQEFYRGLFGWHVDDDNPMGYGIVDTHSEGAGIGGGISGDGPFSNVTIYVGVDDLQAALDKAESLGGKTVAPPMVIPGVVSLAYFSDPEGNVIGMVLDH